MPSSDPPTAKEPPTTPDPADYPAQTAAKGGESKSQKPQEPKPTGEAPKLSGAELKKQKQAEKAARRAQSIQQKQGGGPPAPSPLSASGQASKPEASKGPAGQRKRGGSTAVEVRNMPVRGGAQRTSAPEVPKEEDKTVEFFRHLYRPRTTTIAGAGKEVHPAVLALGLQMSNYTICGSCARLVATLQAFKRVSLFVASKDINFSLEWLLTLQMLIISGHRIIYDTTRKHSHSTSHITCSLTSNRILIIM